MGGGSPGLGWGASCCGVCLAVVCGVLLGCVLLWCDVVLYGRRNLTKNPSLKLSGKSDFASAMQMQIKNLDLYTEIGT